MLNIKTANNWGKFGIPLVVATRLILPFFLWKNALIAWTLVFLVDSFDGEIFRKAFAHQKNDVYQLFDKTLDFYGYCFALAFSSSSAAPIFNVLLFLFVLRAVGMTVFLVKRDRKIFSFFPNIFENLFIVYILTLTFPFLTSLFEGSTLYITLLILSLMTLVREHFLHIKELQLYELLGGKKWV